MGFADEILYDKKIDIVDAGKFVIVNSLALDVSKLGFNPFLKTNNEGDDLMGNENLTAQNNTTVQPVAAIPPAVQQNLQQVAPQNQPAVQNQPVVQAPVNTVPSPAPAQPVDAATAERKRLQDIDAIAANIDPALVNEAKYGATPMSAADLAFKAMQEGKTLNAGGLNAMISANQQSGVNNVQPVVVNQPENDPEVNLGTVAGVNQAVNMIAVVAQANRPRSFNRG
jgi:hypothetical protein